MNFSKLEQLIDTMPARGLHFCDLAVTQNGKEVFRRGAGFSDAAQTKPVSPDDLYWIFSTTKVITCVAALRLVEEGKLKLDDPVSKYLPAYANLTVKQKDGSILPCKNTMTVEHLFTMTGGLTYNLRSDAIREAIEAGASDTKAIVSAIARDPLIFEPGTHYNYSLCHDVLGAVVEVVSGMRFSDYLKAYVFDPLGMKNTGFHPTPAQQERFVAAYRFVNVNEASIPIPNENEFILLPDYDSAGAGLFSCVDDYIKFATALACGGTSPNGYRLLHPETVALMEKNHLCKDALQDFYNPRLFGYGFGLGCRVHMNDVISLSPSAVGEFGWDGAAGAYTLIDRANGVAIYFVMQMRNNHYASNAIHPRIRNLVYEGLRS